MGNNGSISSKAHFRSSLLSFTKWISADIINLFNRSETELVDVFTLNSYQFEYLIDSKTIGYSDSKDLYNNVFLRNSFKNDDNSNILSRSRNTCDKFEVLSLIILLSSLSDLEKIEFLFRVFNFNHKGYLLQAELTLLFMSIINAVYKADPHLISPSVKLCDVLVYKVMIEYAVFDKSKNTLRRSELIKFATETLEIRSFFDAWRGHANQVILASHERYRDLIFPAADISISPSIYWTYAMGLPPSDFIQWIRLPNIYSGYFENPSDNNNNIDITTDISKKQLFTHSTSALKNIARNFQFSGTGILGNGYLIPGLLADKWLMNAIALTCSKPMLFQSLFLNTLQEHIGRYGCQFFEG